MIAFSGAVSMPHAHHDHASHDRGHESHDHARRHAPAVSPGSLLRASAAARLGLALGAAALIWGGVFLVVS
ncbi:MAG: hypothetical protein DI565_09155 [Ancylobacter novellus]|uniref:Uncharacterized protein n=1 Tax=Ancylobacter novellus TaxID=921 RepID=A0A2W5KGD9_ANCNO|nr:MAG: hypothetical protein DI565_09155 [Ancylobacter novellus]